MNRESLSPTLRTHHAAALRLSSEKGEARRGGPPEDRTLPLAPQTRRVHGETPEHRSPLAARSESRACGRDRYNRATGACELRRPCTSRPCPCWCRRMAAGRRLRPQVSSPLADRTRQPASSQRCSEAGPGSACCCKSGRSTGWHAVRAGLHHDLVWSADATRLELHLFDSIFPPVTASYSPLTCTRKGFDTRCNNIANHTFHKRYSAPNEPNRESLARRVSGSGGLACFQRRRLCGA